VPVPACTVLISRESYFFSKSEIYKPDIANNILWFDMVVRDIFMMQAEADKRAYLLWQSRFTK
jgi:hypothetical protein